MEKLKAIDVKGKNYVMVNERLKYFREHFEGYALISDIIEITPDRVCILAKILNGNGSVKATGIAFEEKQSSYINKTSYIENCETSAWGRALANFGIGIDENASIDGTFPRFSKSYIKLLLREHSSNTDFTDIFLSLHSCFILKAISFVLKTILKIPSIKILHKNIAFPLYNHTKYGNIRIL